MGSVTLGSVFRVQVWLHSKPLAVGGDVRARGANIVGEKLLGRRCHFERFVIKLESVIRIWCV